MNAEGIEAGLVCTKGRSGKYMSKKGHKRHGCVKSKRVRRTKSGKCPKNSRSVKGVCKRTVQVGVPKRISSRRRPHNYRTPKNYVKVAYMPKAYADSDPVTPSRRFK